MSNNQEPLIQKSMSSLSLNNSTKKQDIFEKIYEMSLMSKNTFDVLNDVVVKRHSIDKDNDVKRKSSDTGFCSDSYFFEKFKSDVTILVYSSTDDSMYSIAQLVHFIYENKYTVAKLKSKSWFMFDGIKWKQTELGPYYELSIEIVNIYTHFLNIEMNKLENDVLDEKEIIEANIQKFNKIIEKLKNVNTKENICKECLYLFYDSEFMNKLDTNPHLICFQNGVLDLQENKFRKGYSDDYISLSIDMVFSTPSTKKQKHDFSIILDNFHEFRRKMINMRKNKLVFSV
jgi:hypothetical protein